MSSKQINFFIVPEDWPTINKFLKEAGASLIKVPILKIDHIFNESINDDTEAHQIYLTNEVRRNEIVLNPHKAGYYVDVVKSNTIEFNRGGFYPNSNKILHRARFYTVFKYYDDNGDFILKDESFVKWQMISIGYLKRSFLEKVILTKIFFFQITL